MARESGLHRRQDSRFWWIDVVLPNGERVRASTKTENKEEARAFLAKLKLDTYRQAHLGIKRTRYWREAVVRYFEVKAALRSIRDTRRICRMLDPYLGTATLSEINGDKVWSFFAGSRASIIASVSRTRASRSGGESAIPVGWLR